jgi:hypothetical protein
MEHMYNLTVLPASTAAILINGWYKAEHLNGYFMVTIIVFSDSDHYYVFQASITLSIKLKYDNCRNSTHCQFAQFAGL